MTRDKTLTYPLNSPLLNSGRKFKSKWDTFDVDGALARLDAEEEEEEEGKDGRGDKGVQGKERRRATPTLGAVRTELGRLNHDLEKLMACLDQVCRCRVMGVRARVCVYESMCQSEGECVCGGGRVCACVCM